ESAFRGDMDGRRGRSSLLKVGGKAVVRNEGGSKPAKIGQLGEVLMNSRRKRNSLPIRLRQTPATYRLTGAQRRHRLVGRSSIAAVGGTAQPRLHKVATQRPSPFSHLNEFDFANSCLPLGGSENGTIVINVFCFGNRPISVR